jgi:hypothetical protein
VSATTQHPLRDDVTITVEDDFGHLSFVMLGLRVLVDSHRLTHWWSAAGEAGLWKMCIFERKRRGSFRNTSISYEHYSQIARNEFQKRGSLILDGFVE